MSTTPSNSDNSITMSLAELARLEQERVREEETTRAKARDKAAREQKEAEARRLAAEAAQMQADAEARARRLREEAEQRARVEARERAAADVARIEAEAKARLEADNAQRAHELSMLRVKTEGGRRRLQIALAAVLGLTVCGGSAAAYSVTKHVAALEQSAEQLRDGQQALARERENAKKTELQALDRRLAALLARAAIPEAGDARATVEAARKAINPQTLDHDRLRAFGDALDALENRIESAEKVAQLDRRFEDLKVWAAERKRSEAGAAAQRAGVIAKATLTEDAIRAYERDLDQLRKTLAHANVGGDRVATTTTTTTNAGGACLAGDPRCGLDGRPAF